MSTEPKPISRDLLLSSELPQIKAILDHADRLHDAAEINAALDQMAAAMTQKLQHANPLIYTVLNGGLIVAGHLIPRLNFPLQTSYLHATRYGTKTNGESRIEWKVAPKAEEISGRTVVIIDDILDEGYTLAEIVKYCREQGALNVMVAVLLNKRHDRKAPGIKADFIGFEVEDRFLFGCGMDYQGYWRNTLAIYAIKDS